MSEGQDVKLLQEQKTSLIAGLIRMAELMSESEELLKAKDDEILAMQETNKELLARLHACTCDIARLTSMCKKSTLEGTKEEDEETIHDTIQPQVCKVYTVWYVL
jgi:mevalonate kinase